MVQRLVAGTAASKWRRGSIAVGVAATLVLGACGSDDDSSGDDDGGSNTAVTADTGSGSTAPTDSGGDVPADADPNGVLRVATNFATSQPGFLIHPDDGNPGAYYGYDQLIYGTPLRLLPDGSIVPYLAESYEVVDETTFSLTLRDGLTFTDGAPYDAQTLADGILAHRETDSPNFTFALLDAIEDVEVDGLTLTFHLSEPRAGLFPAAMVGADAVVGSPQDTSEIPAGAGPYKVVEYQHQELLKLERNDDFFAADEFLLAGVEFIGLPDPAAAQNALRAGQVDLIATSPADVDALVATGSFDQVVANNEAHYFLTLCHAAAPFDDPKFREAFAAAIDREQINRAVLGGLAEPMGGTLDPASPYAIDLQSPTADQDRARALLEEIGWDESTTVPLGVFTTPVHQRIVEVIQGQLAAVGINTDIVQFTGAPAEQINDSTGGAWLIANVYPGVQKLGISLLEPTSYNACGYNDPEVTELINRISGGALSEDELAEAWEAIQTTIVEDVLNIPLLTQPSVYVYDTTRVGGLEPGTLGLSDATAPAPFLEGVYVIAK